MKRTLTFCCSLVLLTSPAFAGVAWDWNFSSLTGGVIPNINNIDEAFILAGRVRGFRDAPGTGQGMISPGDTFDDFIAIRFSTMIGPVGNNITPLTYGTGPGRTHEVTALATLRGTQISDNFYLVDPGSFLGQAYADFGPTYTGSDFFDLETFRDGTLVETFSGPGGLSGGTNFGPNAIDGELHIVTCLQDQLAGQTGEAWELNSASGLPFNETTLRALLQMSLFSAPPQTALGGLNGGVNGVTPGGGYADVFTGLAGTQLADGTITSLSFHGVPYDFAVASRSEGSFSKLVVVPEPASFAIFSVIGVSLISGRRCRSSLRSSDERRS